MPAYGHRGELELDQAKTSGIHLLTQRRTKRGANDIATIYACARLEFNCCLL